MSIRIIDSHVHLYPAAAAAKVRKFMGQYPIPSHFTKDLPLRFDADHYLTHAASHGVVAAVNLPVAPKESSPQDVSRLNDSCAQIMEEHGGRIFSFGALNPHHALVDIQAEVRRIRALGLLGVKLHPIRNMKAATFQEFDPADEKMFPIYRAIADAGLPLYWHAGSPFREDQTFNATPRKLRMIKQTFFSGQPMYVAHRGGMHFKWEEVMRNFGDLEGVVFDLAYTYFGMSDSELSQVVADVGSRRILLGSDFPYMSVPVTLEGFRAMGALSDSVCEDILFKNAAREFGIKN